MADSPDRAIRGSLKEYSGWIKCMLSDTRCWWRGWRSGLSPASWGWRAHGPQPIWSRRLPRGWIWVSTPDRPDDWGSVRRGAARVTDPGAVRVGGHDVRDRVAARLCAARRRVLLGPRPWAWLDFVVHVGATTVTIVGRDGTRISTRACAFRQRSQAAGGAPAAARVPPGCGRPVSGDLGSAPRGTRAAGRPSVSSPTCSGIWTPSAPSSQCPR
jgi:hypothetical protein